MGRFRQQLIHFVAVLVAINLAAGVVALDARIDKASAVSPEVSGAPSSAVSPGGATAAQSGGVLAGVGVRNRRRSSGQAAHRGSSGDRHDGAGAVFDLHESIDASVGGLDRRVVPHEGPAGHTKGGTAHHHVAGGPGKRLDAAAAADVHRDRGTAPGGG